MPIVLCNKCFKPIPDSYHDFIEICSCKTKQGWIDYYKRRKWMIKIDRKVYDFTIKRR